MMPTRFKKISMFLPAVLLVLVSACATAPGPPVADRPVAYTGPDNQTLLGRYAPVFFVENHGAAYNRIGTPWAAITPDKKETVSVDPNRPTIYTRQRVFATPGGTYTNLVYRVHFAEIPGGWAPFYLGAGQNIGLLVIVTLNSRDQPVLYTTVHTCGCYLAFIPTSFLPDKAWPEGWQKGRQPVYSETLPGFLDFRGTSPEQSRTLIVLRDGTHRVKDVRLRNTDALRAGPRVAAAFQPLSALEKLPVENGATTSFYESSGARTGYVKGSYKVRERLLMSWWSLDWRVGEDKKFGEDKTDGILFYTSLKPWAREASDLRDFAAFLRYWGWHL